MLKTSYRSYVNLGERGSLERFKYLKALGYDAVDYQNFSTEPTKGLYALSDAEFESFLQNERSLAQSIGLEIIQTHGVWPYDDCNKDEYDARFLATIKSIKGSALIGAKYVVLHPYMPSMWNPSNTHKEDIKANIEYHKKLLPYAKEYGVKIAIENMPLNHMPCGTVNELVNCVDAVDSEYFVACLDTGHCNMSGEPGVEGESPADAVRKLGNRLACLHIHDNDSSDDQHLFPYLGKINWDEFLTALKGINYTGPINFECRPPVTPSNLQPTVEKWLSEIGKHFAKTVGE